MFDPITKEQIEQLIFHEQVQGCTDSKVALGLQNLHAQSSWQGIRNNLPLISSKCTI